MARLIVKSPYIKCGGGKSAGGYLKYIATRERVEIIPDDRPPTQKQTQLIAKLVKDFPDAKDLLEYADYASHPTKANASAFISLALEGNWNQVQSMDSYAKYIALRPRAERLGKHGLFGDDDAVDLAAAMEELNHYNGNVWTHIISLHREDAERLGYNHAEAWRTLLRTHRNDIAAAMKIPPEDFRWYAAFHDEGNHPHVHMMAWSAKPNQAYLSKDGIRQIKSTLTNQIFRQEEGSHIVRNAHLIHQGRPVELDNKSRDFFFLQRNNIQDVLGVLVYLVRDKLPGYVHVKPYDIQILTPMRKGELGVERLNQVMQQYLNPPSDEKKEKEIAFGLFREGDKVMQIKNNYQIEWEMRNSKGFTVDKGVGVFNGDMGIITEINDYTEKITVLFDETREVQYPYASLDELELAYAVTIHKSQGSEYPAVVMPILSGPRVLFHRNLLYTGVTRAKNCLTIVGDRNMLFSMIQNVNEQRRYTTLALRLDQIANESEESGPMDDLGI